jgi:hypothetical protein
MAVRKELSGCACAVLAACAAGCGSSSGSAPAAPRVFIGDVSGSDARVGIVATDHSARIYFCGGDATFATMTHWIPSVPIDSVAGDLAQQGASGGWSVVGQVGDAGASGTVTVAGGNVFSFRADPVAAGTIAGLYEAAGPCGKVGLIVAQGSAGQTPAGQGACVPATGGASPEQVNPIRPIERAADGTIAVIVDGAQILVRAAAPPAE